MPDIEKINNVAVADISKLDSITFADGQKVNNQDVSLVTDAHTLISTHDIASLGASSSIDITSGIDSTYDVYEFIFTNIHPQTDDKDFEFQVNAAAGSGFNENITSTFFATWHDEGDSSTHLGYRTAEDQAEGNAYQTLYDRVDSANDAATSGILTLYAPSSTTYVKHFVSRLNGMHADSYTMECHAVGYINTTSAIDEISFKFESGNIDAGVIKMYGLAKS